MKHRRVWAALGLSLVILFSGCVDQSGPGVSDRSPEAEKTVGSGTIAATSVAVVEICERLDMDLVGIPKTSISEIPKRYAQATVIGSPMSPDMEILSQVAPEWVLSPSSLQSDLQPKYEAAGLKYCFLNLTNIFGMYQSIQDMGELFDRQSQADALMQEFEEYYTSYRKEHENQTAPRVLVLMGLPGSYVVATENSYAGSLVALAGGQNIYTGTDQQFLNVNTEDMLQKDPDIILRTAHAMPESVMEMFDEEFRTNDIWKHFSAVKNKRVYDLPSEYFGMSANFTYPKALEILSKILY